jgi:lipoprotein signal peptidase
MTIIIASISFVLAICAFVLTHNATLRAIGIALVIFGITGLIIDYFSKERADNYYKQIVMEIENH